MRLDLHDARDVLQRRLGLAHDGDVLQMDDKTVAEHALVNAVTKIAVEVVQEVVHGHGAVYKLRVAHIGDSLHRSLKALRLFGAVRLVHQSDNLILILQITDQMVDVHRKEEDAAHDDQAGHDNCHRRKGHEAMGFDASEAFSDQITASTQSHSRNTHPFRH